LQLKWKGKGTAKTQDFESKMTAVNDLAEGKVNSVKPTQSSAAPTSARTVARTMEATNDPDQAMDIALEDLINMAKWLQSVENQAARLTLSGSSAEPNDNVREALVKRVQALKAALPPLFQPAATTALMHVEHEILKKNYQDIKTTMYGDDVADIPRENFWVSEDGYPWDMEELAGAIKANSGVFRNPLSRTMFTPADVQAIIKHPLGRGLAALQVQQSQLRKGIRMQTIEMMEKLATTLLEDMSTDQLASRHVVDEFLAYVATLPQSEQESIDGLRVPAKDSHTGQAFGKLSRFPQSSFMATSLITTQIAAWVTLSEMPKEIAFAFTRPATSFVRRRCTCARIASSCCMAPAEPLAMALQSL
jgi:hypothetical protein